jgi:hypothetical protein
MKKALGGKKMDQISYNLESNPRWPSSIEKEHYKYF